MEPYERFITPLAAGMVLLSSMLNLDYTSVSPQFLSCATTYWWLSLGCGAVLALVAARVITLLPENSQGKGIVEWNAELLGMPLGTAASVATSLGLLVLSAQTLSILTRLTQLIMLPKSSTETLMLLCVVLGTYIARQAFGVVVRLSILVLLISPALALGSAALILLGVDTRNFLPLVGPDTMHSLKALSHTIPLFRGVGTILLIAPHLTRPDKAFKTTVAAVLAGGAAFSLVAAATIGVLGPHSSEWLLHPTVIAFQTAELTGSGAERLDIAINFSTVLSGFALLARPLYFATFTFARAVGLRDHASLVPIAAPVLYILARRPSNTGDVTQAHAPTSWLGWIVLVGLPMIPALVLLVRRRWNGGGSA